MWRHALFTLALVAVAMLIVVADSADPAGPAPETPAPSLTTPSLTTPTVRDFGAVGDGRADDTAALQRAVDSRLGDVRLPRGVYRITKPVVIDLDRLGHTSFSGSGTARIVMAGPGPALKFIGTHEGTASPASVEPNVWERQRMPAVDGIEIRGAHPQAVGIEATGTMQMLITRVNIRETLYGIHLTVRNRNVIISACHLYENRGIGLFLDDVDLHQINVTGCHISYNPGGGIVSRAGNVRNLHVSGCDIEANMTADAPATANVLLDCTGGRGGIAEVAITGCTIQHTHAGPDSANIRFIGTDGGGRLNGNVTIGDNVLSDVHVNVDIQKARGVSIVGNTFWKAVDHDLRVRDSSNVLVGPNLFDRNSRYNEPMPTANGLLFSNCSDLTITGIHVNGVLRKPAGLILRDCRRVNVTGCTILDCQNAGLLLENVTASHVSDCLILNDRPDAQTWVPLKILGGGDNLKVDNLTAGNTK